jgi:hypothetical protein
MLAGQDGGQGAVDDILALGEAGGEVGAEVLEGVAGHGRLQKWKGWQRITPGRPSIRRNGVVAAGVPDLLGLPGAEHSE